MAKQSRPNVTEWNSYSYSIHILKANKGNATVIMSKTDFEDKAKDILSSDTYNKLKRDPIPFIEGKVK